MTVNPSIDPARVLEEQLAQASPDLLRELLTTFINTLMSAEADTVSGKVTQSQYLNLDRAGEMWIWESTSNRSGPAFPASGAMALTAGGGPVASEWLAGTLLRSVFVSRRAVRPARRDRRRTRRSPGSTSRLATGRCGRW